MKGMVLAAGLGTRLRPLTYEIPKPVVPVLGRPLCSYNLEFLRRHGVSAFVMNLHAHPKIVQQKVAGWAGRSVPVDFTFEPVILGTGGGIRNAAPLLGRDPFVAVNGDTVVRFPLDRALAFHRAQRALATLVLFPDPGRRYTPVWVDGEDRITGFGRERGTGERTGFYTGCQIVDPQLLSRIPGPGASCIIRETYAPLAREGAPVFGFLCEGQFLEFGTVADYLEGTLSLLRGRAGAQRLPAGIPEGVTVKRPVYVSPGARVERGAALGPGAVLEDGCSVGENASVEEGIVWPGASLPRGERLHRAILTSRRRVEATP